MRRFHCRWGAIENPSTLRFSVRRNRPPIVLSHWKGDHRPAATGGQGVGDAGHSWRTLWAPNQDSGSASDTAWRFSSRSRPASSATTPDWEMEKGIFAAWVPDALGYHLPQLLRERSIPPTAIPDSAYEQPLMAGNTNASASTLQVQEEMSMVAPTSVCRSRSSSDNGCAAPPFCGPLPRFSTSPVFRWMGCLWQWRPIVLTAPPKSATSLPTSREHFEVATSRSSGEHRWDEAVYSGTTQLEGKVDARRRREVRGLAPTDPDVRSGPFFLVPFLLCPTAEIPASQPQIHATLHRELLAACGAYRSQGCDGRDRGDGLCREGGSPSSSTAAAPPLHRPALMMAMPSPVGDLAVRPHGSLSIGAKGVGTEEPLTFSIIECHLHSRRLRGTRKGTSITTSFSSLFAAAAAESLKPSTDAAADHQTSPVLPLYTHVFTCPKVTGAEQETPHTPPPNQYSNDDAAKTLATSQKSAQPPLLPTMYRNMIGGGVAELIMAMDRYAALVARDALTLSAACWATLCDTTCWWVVQHLRLHPLEIERELLAAVEAHRLWQQHALTHSRTLVGKSSQRLCLYDYPRLAQWMGSQRHGDGAAHHHPSKRD